MKNTKLISCMLVAWSLLFVGTIALAQDEEEKEKPRPQRAAFESAILLANQTDVINGSKTLEWAIQHRFGTVTTGSSDLWGIFASSNIRLGFSYSIMDRLSIGLGATKISVTNPYIDGNIKGKILQQARSGGSPINLTAYANVVIDTRNEDNFATQVHRFSYFAELILSRRFTKNFSLQLCPQYSHFNAVDALYKNDVFGLSLGGRIKVSSQGSIIFEWTEPLTEHPVNTAAEEYKKDAGPNRNVSFGYEVSTSAHAFQFFIGVYRSILPQYNLSYNTNQFFKKIDDSDKLSFAIGFNMTRLWGF
jgi:hypothetical protein